MGTFGRTVEESTGRPVQVSADGRPDWKVGGVTIDWSAIDAVSGSPETLDDDTVVAVGDKFIRYGTIVTRDDSSGKYAPTDAPIRGESFILNETVVMSELGSNHPPVIEGGQVWAARLNVDGVGQPTLEEVLVAFPRLQLVTEGDVADSI